LTLRAAVRATGSTDDLSVPTEKAVRDAIEAILGAADAMVFKGAIDCSGNPNYPAADAGHTYKVSVAGNIGGAAGPVVQVNDTIICSLDGSVAGTHAAVGANWFIIQGNIDGAVIGPASSTDENIVIFDGTGGRLIKDSAVAIATVTDHIADSDIHFTEGAIDHTHILNIGTNHILLMPVFTVI